MTGTAEKTGLLGNSGALARLVLISGAVILLDQATKAFITATLALHQSVTVIEGFFDITHVLNPGGAFGLFAGHSPEIRVLFFMVISTLVAVMILWLYRQTAAKHRVLSYALAGIFGGAVGNLIDRFRMGKVIDFLDLYIGAWHWPAFNVADSAISVGMAVFLYHVAFNKISDLGD
jgi:signal peptidase II